MRTISASEARQGFAELLESTREGPVLIERQKRGVAVVMSVEEYDRLLADAPAAGGKRGLPTNPALMQLYPAYPLEGGQTHWQAIQVQEPLAPVYESAQSPNVFPGRVPSRKKRQMGTLKGKIKVPDDFDTWMADEIADLFEGKDSALPVPPVDEGKAE